MRSGCRSWQNTHGPFLADVALRQVKQLKHGLVTREGTANLGDLAQTHVHCFNRVSRVDHFADLPRVGKSLT